MPKIGGIHFAHCAPSGKEHSVDPDAVGTLRLSYAGSCFPWPRNVYLPALRGPATTYFNRPAYLNQSAADRRTHGARNDTLSTMKVFFSIMLAFAICAASVQAGPVRTARNVAKSTAITAKNVAHSTVKGTRRAVHTVVNTFTP